MNYRTKVLFIQVAFGMLFLTLGVGKLVEPKLWIDLVPDWGRSILPVSVDIWMYYAAWVEIVLGLWMVLPIKQHIAALLAFLYYIPWTLMAGFTYTSIKDATLLLVLFALVLLSWPKEYKLSFDE